MPVLVEELTRLEGHKWQISCLEFSPDGSRLATGSWDKEVRIWNLGSLDTAVVLNGLHEVPVTSLAWFKPEGTLLATGSADTMIGLWNGVTGEKLLTLKDCFGWVLDISFSMDGNFLGAASWDKMVRLWEPNTGSLLNTLRGHKAGVWSLDFHSERNILCSGSADGTVRLWDARSNKCAAVLGEEVQTNPIHSVKWSPDNITIASASADTKVTLWDVRRQEPVNVLSGHSAAVKSVTFNYNTHNVAIPVLASAGDYSLKVWDPRPTSPGHPLVNLSLHQPGKEVEAVAISPDGSLVATGARDGVVILMTLFVPTILPRTDSEIKREQHKKTFRNSFRLARHDSFSKSGKAEAEITDFALDQMMAEPKLPQNTQLKRIHSRLKRRTRTTEKDIEIDQEATITEKEKVNIRKSRKNRARVKSIDLPDMIMHLAAKVTAYKPEVFSDSDSGDDQAKDKTIQQKKTQNTAHGKVTAALKTFQSQPDKKETAKGDLREPDSESMHVESGSHSMHDLDSSSSNIGTLSPSSHQLLSDIESATENSDVAFSPSSSVKDTSTLSSQFSKENSKMLQNGVLPETPTGAYQNDTSHSTEGKADDEDDDDDIPYSMI